MSHREREKFIWTIKKRLKVSELERWRREDDENGHPERMCGSVDKGEGN